MTKCGRKCSIILLAKRKKDVRTGVYGQCYGKIASALKMQGTCGGMAERLKAHVLKTCLGHTNVGSNPTPSAIRSSSLE
jgi:hypothetical protein